MQNMYLILILTLMVLGIGCSTDNMEYLGLRGEQDRQGGQGEQMPQEQFRAKLIANESFVLKSDIILTDWASVPSYSGKLDGQGKKLIIKSFKADARGLIKAIGEGGEVKDLNIELGGDVTFEVALDISYGEKDEAGILAGTNKGKIEGVKVSGGGQIKRVKIGKNVSDTTGGLIGKNEKTGHISNSSSELMIEGEYYVGGLVALNMGGTIEGSYAKGAVRTTGEYSYIGGLVGYNWDGSKIEGSYAEGSVYADGRFARAGGLIGHNNGRIEGSHAKGSVTTTKKYSYAGGLVGYSWDRSKIEGSYATGDVIGYDAGGLVGWNRAGAITKSGATGDVSGYYAGGLVGENFLDGSIKNSYAKGNVSGYYIGGLVGQNDSIIENSYATGNVSASVSRSRAGGLIGQNRFDGKIKNSYAKGNVSNYYSYTGELIGENFSKNNIENSFCLARSGLNPIGNGYASGVREIATAAITDTTFTNAGWSKDVWKNLVAGQWPKLKWQP